jgi:hypothetical protein
MRVRDERLGAGVGDGSENARDFGIEKSTHSMRAFTRLEAPMHVTRSVRNWRGARLSMSARSTGRSNLS